MNALAFYIGCTIYFYFRIFHSHNTDMIHNSFHIAVLLGILALLHRR